MQKLVFRSFSNPDSGELIRAIEKAGTPRMGQTCRQKKRISEHKNPILRNTSTHSVITEHRLQFNHDFDWEDVEILDVERNFNKRLISEMINIKCQKNGINLQSDIEALDYVYFSYFNTA